MKESSGSLCELICLSSLKVYVATKCSRYQSLQRERPILSVLRNARNNCELFSDTHLNTSTLFPDSANSPIFSTRTSELLFNSGTIYKDKFTIQKYFRGLPDSSQCIIMRFRLLPRWTGCHWFREAWDKVVPPRLHLAKSKSIGAPTAHDIL